MVTTGPGGTWQVHAPHLPWFALDRPRLQQRIDSALGRALTTVVAPAGYGKSVLLAQWVARPGRRCAWLRVDAEDGDAGRFGRRLLGAGAVSIHKPPTVRRWAGASSG